MFKLLAAKRVLDNYVHYNEKLGIYVSVRMFLTMVDSGLVNKLTDNDDQHKCRICRRRMLDVRNEGNHICNNVHFSPELNMSMVEFGHSPTHWVLHIGMVLKDIADRRAFRKWGVQGYADLKKTTEKIVHDEILDLLGIHVSLSY